ncbi:MAG: dihydropteroate synthase [bacterium]
MNQQRATLRWRCRDRTIELGARTAIMGVLNVTPDSFSDGGRFVDLDAAVGHAQRMARDGADIIDIGGESSRPGAATVGVEEEMRRVIPVVERVAAECPCLVSIDTTKAAVARRAIEKGAHIVNDISAFSMDPQMSRVVADTGAGAVLMHMKGVPRTMQQDPVYADVVAEVVEFLRARVEHAVAAGMEAERLAVDPGIGFGKTVEQNVQLLRGLGALRAIGRPIMVGLSRKSFLGTLTGREVGDRGAASLGGLAFAVLRGAHVVRVHDVIESCDVAKVLDMLSAEDVSSC